MTIKQTDRKIKIGITDLLLRREVVHDVEQFSDLLRGLSLDHIRYCLASNVTVVTNKKG